ncbi:MAG: DUF3068 domain-containing protein [Chloroflexi bacterium]|nr:DUF3068 domain-containing protein [Chloroflexota bacterium]
MRIAGRVLVVIGIIGVIFGIVWALAIFPNYKKIPSDFSRTEEFVGTYTLLDPIVQQIQSSQAIQQLIANPQTLALLASEDVLQFLSGPELPALLADPATLQNLVANLGTLEAAASPETIQLLADPQVQQFLASPELAALLANPATLQALTANLGTLQQATDPATVALLANPAVQQLLASPGAIQLLTDPTVLALLADPVAASQSTDPAVQQLLANPIVQGLLANPALLQALASPGVQNLLANPSALQLILDPTVQSVITDPVAAQLLANPGARQLLANPTALQPLLNPTVQAVLANPAVPLLLSDATVQQLLGDPASLQLVTDPRTMRLLKDPTDLPVVQVPVLIHRERAATDSTSNSISINEQVTTTRTDIGEEMAQFPKSNINLVVDRGDKDYLDGTEGGRTGGLAFPFGIKKDTVYPTWVSAARQPLDARYVSTETIDGLEVFVLEIDVANLGMPALGSDPGPLVDSQITIRAEPRSGRVVDVEDHATTVSLVSGVDTKSPVFVSDIEYTQETVDTQIEKAKDDRHDLVYFGTSLPRLNVVFGILFILLGVFLHQLPRIRGTRA